MGRNKAMKRKLRSSSRSRKKVNQPKMIKKVTRSTSSAAATATRTTRSSLKGISAGTVPATNPEGQIQKARLRSHSTCTNNSAKGRNECEYQLVSLRVQVPSVKHLFQKYGRYFVVTGRNTESGTGAAAAQGQVQVSTKPDSKENFDSKRILPRTTRHTERQTFLGAHSAANEQDGNNVTHSEGLTGTRSNRRSGRNAAIKRKSLEREKEGNEENMDKLKSPDPEGIGPNSKLVDQVQACVNIAENNSSSSLRETAPLLPKRICLQKSLIRKMLSRVSPSKRTGLKFLKPPPIDPIESQSKRGLVHVTEVNAFTINDNSLDKNPTEDSKINEGGNNKLLTPKLETISDAEKKKAAVHAFLTEEADDGNNAITDNDCVLDLDLRPESACNFGNGTQAAIETIQKTDTSSNPTHISPVCKTCNARFLNDASFKIHMREIHEYGKSCEELETQTETKTAPKRVPLPQRKAKFFCENCQLSFSQAGLKLHKRYKHPELFRKEQQNSYTGKLFYVCSFPQCESLLSSMQNMKIHKCVRHESQTNKFIQCILCPSSFQGTYHFYYHLRKKHKGEVDKEGFREFADCGVGLAQENLRQVYGDPNVRKIKQSITISSEQVEKKTCQECALSFLLEKDLVRHMETFHGSKVSQIISVARNKSSTNSAGVTLVSAGKQITMPSQTIPKDSTRVIEPEIITLSDDEEVIDTECETSSKQSFTKGCPYCGKYISSAQFITHVESHSSVTTYKIKKFDCHFQGCVQTFDTFKEVQSHFNINHTIPSNKPSTSPVPAKYDCELCPPKSSMFTNLSTLEDHLKTIHNARSAQHKPYGSPENELATDITCGTLIFSDKSSLRSHCETSYRGMTYNRLPDAVSALAEETGRLEQECIKSSEGLSITPVSSVSSTSNISKENEIAMKKVSTTIRTSDINRSQHPSFKFQCSICGRHDFSGRSELNNHILTHRSKPQASLHTDIHTCGECNLPFFTLEDKYDHMTQNHPSASACPVTCPICKIEMKLPRHLSTHISNVHRMYQCDCCSQLFKEEALYLRHIQLHTIQKSSDGKNVSCYFRCLECKDRTFLSRKFLIRHYEANHRGGIKCICATCNIQLQRQNLKNHLEIHSLDNTNGLSLGSDITVRKIILQSKSDREMAIPTKPSRSNDHIVIPQKNQKNLEGALKKSAAICSFFPVTSNSEAQLILPDPLDIGTGGGNVERLEFVQPYSANFEFEDVAIGEYEPSEKKKEGKILSHPPLTAEPFNCVGFIQSDSSSSEFESASTPSRSTPTQAGKFVKGSGKSLLLNELRKKETFRCSVCLKNFGRKYSLERHLKDIHGYDPKVRQIRGLTGYLMEQTFFSCKVCSRDFDGKDPLTKHLKDIHSIDESAHTTFEKYTCRLCWRCWPTKLGFTRHLEHAHNLRADEETSNPKKTEKIQQRCGAAESQLPRNGNSLSCNLSCKHCGLCFLEVAEQKKHELEHVEGKNDDAQTLPVVAAAPFEEASEAICDSTVDVFLPGEGMMQSDMELPATIGMFKGENEAQVEQFLENGV